MRTRFLMRSGIPAMLWLFVVSAPGLAQLRATVTNWRVPTSAQAPSSHVGGIRALGDVTNPVAFIGVTPCRVVDTRGAGDDRPAHSCGRLRLDVRRE
jgi:hypothetical protein